MNDFDQRLPGRAELRPHRRRGGRTRSFTLRSTLSSERSSTSFAFGITRGERIFFGQADSSGGPQTFDDTGGYAIDLDANIGLTNWHTRNTLSGRSAYQYTFDETLTLAEGQAQRHASAPARSSAAPGTIAAAGGARHQPRLQHDQRSRRGHVQRRPNFPGRLGGAARRRARCCTRCSPAGSASVTGQAALDPETNKYSFLGKRRRHGKLDNYSAFVQDSWRMTPTLTLNAGLRWDVQTPFSPRQRHDVGRDPRATSAASPAWATAASTAPATSTTRARAAARCRCFEQFTTGTGGYNTDWNNVAPNVGVAWRPQRAERLAAHAARRSGAGDAARRLLGRLRAQGFAEFTGVFGPNPGSTLSLTRDANTGLVPPGESWPVLLRETNRLYPAPFPETPTYPIAVRAEPRPTTSTRSIPTSRSRRRVRGRSASSARCRATWRSRPATSARAASTSGRRSTTTSGNLIENGFFDEFKLAMANLQANNAAGGDRAPARSPTSVRAPARRRCRSTSRTSNGRTRRDERGRLHAATTWTNTALTQDWSATNPQPVNSAADLDGDLTRRNQRARRRPAGELLRRQSARRTTSTSPTAARSATTTRCRSSCGGGCRRGLQFNAQLPVRASKAARRSSASTTAA